MRYTFQGRNISANIFKNLRNGPLRPRDKSVLDLEKSLAGARCPPEILHEARPYFHRDDPMDSGPMLFQL